MCNCCSHGTLLHTSVFKVLTWILATTTKICSCGRSTWTHVLGFYADHSALLLVRVYFHSTLTVRYRSNALALSIFRAGWFGRWVVTHSLADVNFHDHRPAVSINQHLLWFLMSVCVRHLNQTFGSSHSASSAYQNWPTWHFKHALHWLQTQASQLSYPFKVWE